jgi:hypothetical protein
MVNKRKSGSKKMINLFVLKEKRLFATQYLSVSQLQKLLFHYIDLDSVGS